jgi:hypothetical protein
MNGRDLRAALGTALALAGGLLLLLDMRALYRLPKGRRP